MISTTDWHVLTAGVQYLILQNAVTVITRGTLLIPTTPSLATFFTSYCLNQQQKPFPVLSSYLSYAVRSHKGVRLEPFGLTMVSSCLPFTLNLERWANPTAAALKREVRFTLNFMQTDVTEKSERRKNVLRGLLRASLEYRRCGFGPGIWRVSCWIWRQLQQWKRVDHKKNIMQFRLM